MQMIAAELSAERLQLKLPTAAAALCCRPGGERASVGIGGEKDALAMERNETQVESPA